jgi:hypothetical protein
MRMTRSRPRQFNKKGVSLFDMAFSVHGLNGHLTAVNA